jgi:hypothetical protein
VDADPSSVIRGSLCLQVSVRTYRAASNVTPGPTWIAD